MTANAWFAFVLFGLVAYVALDGYDLGIGTLAMAHRRYEERFSLLEIVARVWDGNESWLLLVALGLWGGFPAMFGGFFPAIYIPAILMLFSFAARGVSIEMLSNAGKWRTGWGRMFMGGSLCAAFLQGVILGTFVQGVPLGPNAHFDGGTFDFLTGYTVLTGLTAVALYTLAGAAMVKMRSQESPLVASVRAQGKRLVLLAGGLVVLSAVLLPVAGASSLTLDQPFRVAVLIWTSIARGSHVRHGMVELWTDGPYKHGIRRRLDRGGGRCLGPRRHRLPDDPSAGSDNRRGRVAVEHSHLPVSGLRLVRAVDGGLQPLRVLGSSY